jgi:hypothetical protein
MQKGDLRRFKDGLKGSGKTVRLSGQHFMVIDVYTHRNTDGYRTDFLVGSRIETGWNARWIEDRSEVLNAAG